MKINAPPDSEAARLRRLRELGLHDTQDDAILDVFVDAIAEYCQAPIAFVSVLASDRQLIRSSIGLQVEDVSREQSFCNRLLAHDNALLEISDFGEVEQGLGDLFGHADHPVHFYAGHTLSTSDGHVVGSLVVMDTRARQLSTIEREAMQRIAKALSSIIDKQHLSTYARLDNVVLRNINQGILLTDTEAPDCVITYCNDAIVRMTGFARAELLGRNNQFLLGSDPAPEVVERFRHGMQAQIEFTLRVRQPCKDGHLLWVEYNTKPIFDEDNELCHYLSIITDVTMQHAHAVALESAKLATEQRVVERTAELQSSNESLRESQNALEQLLDQAPDATLVVNTNGRISRANARALDMFAGSDRVLVGKLLEELLPSDLRRLHREHRTNFNSAPSARSMGSGLNLYALSASGKRIPVDVNLSPIEISGEPFVVAAVRDVSDRVQREEAVEQARQEAEDANTSKSRFLATASHDLRQPLQSLGIYLSVLQRMLSSPEAIEVCGKMRNSLDAMADLLNLLLDVSRFESGSVEPQLADFELQTVFDSVRAEFEPAAAEKNLSLAVQHTDLKVNSDRALLQRVIDNLVSNAIKYTKAGSVIVQARVVRDAVILEVSDTGIGIADQDQHRIFGEYVQLDNPQRDRRQGLGLGLAIVSRICRLLGIPLRVQSEPDKGSCFRLEIPPAKDSVRELEDVSNNEALLPLKHKSVLLVDDDEAIVDSLSIHLSALGINVTTAFSFAEAIGYLDGGYLPDLIVSDYRLPDNNGIELIAKAREANNKPLAAVLMTGDTSLDLNIPEKLLDIEVLYKPVKEEQLISTLCALL